MKERPILFQGAMVRALLDGTKTQTRRIAKEIPYGPDADHFGKPIMDWDLSGVYQNETNSAPDRWWCDIQCDVDDNSHDEIRCPYGAAGDRLWVRETWAQPTNLDPGPTVYRADYPACVPPDFTNLPSADEITWKPSIHMPRALSRIQLEIVSVRVERLQTISEPDARAEGITDGGCVCCGDPEPCRCPNPSPDARDSYCHLWESINGAGSWSTNPWVWVVEFKRVAP